jgi:hypothetical protein
MLKERHSCQPDPKIIRGKVENSSWLHQRVDTHRERQTELKNRIHKWLQEIEEPGDGDDDANSSNGNSTDFKFADGEAFEDFILYHPDFSDWALAEDLKRQLQLENEGTISRVLDQAQSSLSKIVRDFFFGESR